MSKLINFFSFIIIVSFSCINFAQNDYNIKLSFDKTNKQYKLQKSDGSEIYGWGTHAIGCEPFDGANMVFNCTAINANDCWQVKLDQNGDFINQQYPHWEKLEESCSYNDIRGLAKFNKMAITLSDSVEDISDLTRYGYSLTKRNGRDFYDLKINNSTIGNIIAGGCTQPSLNESNEIEVICYEINPTRCRFKKVINNTISGTWNDIPNCGLLTREQLSNAKKIIAGLASSLKVDISS